MRPSEKAAKRLIAGGGRCRHRRPARCQRRRQSPRPARLRRRGWPRVPPPPPPGPARPGPAARAPRAPRRNLCLPWERRRVLFGRRGWAWWYKDGTGVKSSGACGERQRAQRITRCGVVSEEAVSPGRKAKALGHHGVTVIGKLHFPTGMGKFGGDPRHCLNLWNDACVLLHSRTFYADVVHGELLGTSCSSWIASKLVWEALLRRRKLCQRHNK
ncbi:uncharacterized protein LOC127061032 [Serinus canaria]|uniref:uncharacterized protein LOC127061032 n=1 Tax=Serinus canaria TaxID=9135 RepID=UPI0021CCD3FC|nr:uncharacterized protein LOC127061032 [Serinus canaria]